MKLEHMLQSRRIRYEKHSHAPAYTSQALAQAEHVSGYEVAKPVVVKTAVGFTMCVLPAPLRLDLHAVSELLHDPHARLATESEMREIFDDCELGAEPPIGDLYGMNTVMDESLRRDEHITFQAGTHTEAIRLRRADWERLCRPTVAPIAHA
ncbi:MAG: deacylase [Planctomycetota bacterium]|nr:MAG: deacylase [Planctomycetota bacterium]